MKEKVVLAYSGGLDTSYCVKYLSEELGLEVYKLSKKKLMHWGRRNMLTWM